MSIWYSMVKYVNRMEPESVVRRKVELVGWQDRPEIAYYAIGQKSDNREDLKGFKSCKEFIDEFSDLLDFSDSNEVTIELDNVVSQCEEWNSGVAKSMEKAKECYAISDVIGFAEDEWKMKKKKEQKIECILYNKDTDRVEKKCNLTIEEFHDFNSSMERHNSSTRWIKFLERPDLKGRHIASLRSICETLGPNGKKPHCTCGKRVSDPIHFTGEEFNKLSAIEKCFANASDQFDNGSWI